MTSLRLKIQLSCGDRFAIGPGKADLLAAIAAEKSISGAARSMDMSYRRAWLLVDELNRCFTDKLVETLSGGGRERGARLTTTGQRVLDAYRALQKKSGMTLSRSAHFRELDGLIRSEPIQERPR